MTDSLTGAIKKDSTTDTKPGTPSRTACTDAPTNVSATEVPTIKQPDDQEVPAPATNAPLAPPPKPTQHEDSDYFGAPNNNGTHLAKEPNPFENAFGNPAETPGKPHLPGVTSLTSPASLLPGNTPGWPGSLRSGPLSPAMLTGPTGSHDYFNSDHHFNGSFPTPNESSLRSGLTPGGGGSMFPHASPNSQALYNHLQSGGATPGTLDFHRTAMSARTQTQANTYSNMTQNGVTSQPQAGTSNIQPDLDAKPYQSGGPHHQQGQQQQQQQDSQDPFGSHQTNDAANGLFMLAQAGGQQRNNQQQQGFAMPQQPQQGYGQNMQQEQSNIHTHKRGAKTSVGSTMSVGSTENGQGDYLNGAENGHGDYSDGGADTKPNARNGRGKKASGAKATNGKRKPEDMPAKVTIKKQRGNDGMTMPEDDMDEDDMGPDMDDETGPDGRKMTDEEKRKNFLERNRYVHPNSRSCQ